MKSEIPSDYRKHFEHNILHCDALMIVYGNSSVNWVRDQFLTIRKVTWRRQQPFMGFAIYDGPPEQKPSITTTLPQKVYILECREQLDEDKLRNFVELIPMN